MKRYIFKETEESGSYIRGDSYLMHLTIRDNLDKSKSTPSSVNITIQDPCDFTLIDEAAMTNDSTGIYYYDYDIDSSATYGIYSVTVSTATYNQKEVYHFYLFPWDVEDKVRAISGIGQGKMISDTDLNEIIWESYKTVNEQVYDVHCDVKPKSCWTSCSGHNYCINGSNTTFFVDTDLADHNGDGLISGWGQQSCGTDVDGYYEDCDGWIHQVKITVDNASSGRLTVTKLDGTAIESTANGVFFTYYTEACTFKEDIFREAVMYLAAHKCILRFGELERASSADLTAAQNIKYVDPERMWQYYRKCIALISTPKAGGVY